MDELGATFPAAPPGNIFSSEEHAGIYSSQRNTELFITLPGNLGVREAARQQWEALKPLIQRVYIDEDKPYGYLAKLLRTEHGFETTKRQFSRKIAQWGFRKNISSAERHDILKALSQRSRHHVLGDKDHRLKPGKLKNWRRRYGDDVNGQSRHHFKYHSSNSEPVSGDTRASSIASDKQTVSGRLDAFPRPGTLESSPPVQSLASSEIATGAPSRDIWPFNWSTVEVPRSPNLSRLFAALEIESSNPVPALSLEPGYLEDSQPCISESEIQDLFNEENRLLNFEIDQLHSSVECKGSVPTRENPTSLNPHPLLQDITAVILGYSANPFNELYVFSPPLSSGPVEVNLSTSNIWESLASKETDLRTKLAKLKPQFGASHPSVMATMESLSEAYYSRRKYEEAERLDQELLKQYSKTLGSGNLKTLDVYQRLIDSLIAQGKYYAARSLNRSLFSSLVQIGHLGTPRVAHAISNDALIAEELGNTEEAESLHRQVLQMWLTYCGPRDKRTLNSMTQLGYILVLTKGPGGDTLLRTAVQLHLEVSTAGEEETCRAMTNLSAAFWAQDTHEEGCKLARNALKRFCSLLGDEHPDILATKVALARNLTKEGCLLESEKLFREVVSTESEIRDSTKPDGLSNSSYGLARVLMMRGCYGEAIQWFMEVVQARADAYGWGHRYTLRVCYDLGDCYHTCKRYEDGIIFYRDVVRRLWMTGRHGNLYHPDMDYLESFIKKLEALSSEGKALYGGESVNEGEDGKCKLGIS